MVILVIYVVLSYIATPFIISLMMERDNIKYGKRRGHLSKPERDILVLCSVTAPFGLLVFLCVWVVFEAQDLFEKFTGGESIVQKFHRKVNGVK